MRITVNIRLRCICSIAPTCGPFGSQASPLGQGVALSAIFDIIPAYINSVRVAVIPTILATIGSITVLG